MEIVEIASTDAQKILGLQEGHFIEFKSKSVSPGGLSKVVSAFANTSGGEIYVGIDEEVGLDGKTRTWNGFVDQEQANSIVQVLEEMSPLNNHYALEFLTADGMNGLLVHISVGKSRHILKSSTGDAYVRRNAQNLPVRDPDALRRLEYDKGIVSFEDEVTDALLKDVANSTVMIDFMLSIVPSAEPEAWVSKQRLAKDDRPTVAGVLLFAEEPQAILPKRSAIKVYRYKTSGDGERDTLAADPLTMEGATCELIYSTVDKCKEIAESIEKLGPDGLEKVLYPPEALHEVITNAVLHRDYSIATDIHVRIYDNRIEIESPGRFPGHITASNVLSEQFARNPKLVRLANKFPDAPNKDVGEGLNTVFEAMQKLRLHEPVITEKENSVLVVLKHESLNSPEQIIRDYMKSHDTVTNVVGRRLTGIKSENSMKNVFYRLREAGEIELIPGKRVWRKTRRHVP